MTICSMAPHFTGRIHSNLHLVSDSSSDEGSTQSLTAKSCINTPSKTKVSRVFIPTTLKNLKLPDKKARKAKNALSKSNRKRPIKQGFVVSTRDVVINKASSFNVKIPSHANTEFMIIIQKHISHFLTGNARDRHTLAEKIVQSVTDNGGRFLEILPQGCWKAAGWEASEKFVFETFSKVVADRNLAASRAAAAAQRKDVIQNPIARTIFTPAMLATALERYQEQLDQQMLLDILARQMNYKAKPVSSSSGKPPLKSILRNGNKNTRPAVPTSRVVRICSSAKVEPERQVVKPERTALSLLSAVAEAVERAEQKRKVHPYPLSQAA